jgi:hypothetical protein
MVTVEKVPPVITLNGPQSAELGGTVAIRFSAAQAGADRITSWTINWGDGLIERFDGSETSVSHRYSFAGSFILTLTAADGDGAYSAQTPLEVIDGDSGFTAIGSADINGDGKPDVIRYNASTGIMQFWLMDGMTKASALFLDTPVDADLTFIAAQDFNRDGWVDLLFRSNSTGQGVVWYLNGVNVVATGQLPDSPGADWVLVGSGDIDRNGSPDVLWRNTAKTKAGKGANLLWLMDGMSVVKAVSLPKLAVNWSVAAIADMNRDGYADIIFRNPTSGAEQVWLMAGTRRKSVASLPAQKGSSWRLAAAADFNGDGMVDLLWENDATGEEAVWLMKGYKLPKPPKAAASAKSPFSPLLIPGQG